MVRVDRKPGVVLVTDPPPAHVGNGTVAFLNELNRLHEEVRHLTRSLDRIEVEMRQALSDLARERFEAC